MHKLLTSNLAKIKLIIMAQKLAKVIEVRSASIIEGGKINPAEALKMLEVGLDNLSPTGVSYDLLDQLFPLKETIGIKVNTLVGKIMSTSPEMAYSLAEILHRQGHKKKNIIIWDRREDELSRAGYKITTRGSDYLCFATDTRGVGFARELFSYKTVGSLISRIQTELTDSVVNFPILKDHSLAGLSGCLKNYFGVIHNPNKYHENNCDPYQADLYSMNIIKGKQKLAVFDAVRVQFNGGPGYVPRWATDYKAVLLATDAVALDRVALEIIDRLRTQNGLAKLKDSGREAISINTSGNAGLGCAELDKIEWIVTEV